MIFGRLKDLTELIRDNEPDLLYHHSRRVYLFAALTGQREGLAYILNDDADHNTDRAADHLRRADPASLAGCAFDGTHPSWEV